MTESEDDYRLLVETISSLPSHCPKCGTVANLYKHGKKKQLFFDLPMHAKRVGIYIKRHQLPNWAQTGYDWVYEEVYGADFSTLIKAMEEGSF